jgi:hypothetical protein
MRALVLLLLFWLTRRRTPRWWPSTT